MKHLRPFNESTLYDLSKEVKDTLKDICLELDDLGYQIINGREYTVFPYLSIRNHDKYMCRPITHPERIKDNDVSEVIERIKDYMDSVGYTTIVKLYSNQIDIDFRR